jgi:two-component system, LytTR family, sensor kinase
MFATKPNLVLAHVVGWALFMTLILLFVSDIFSFARFIDALLSWQFLNFCVTYVIIFYVNEQLLFPRLYLRKKYWLYGICVAAFLALVCIVRPYDNLHQGYAPLPPGPPSGFGPKGPALDIISIIVCIMVLCLSGVLQVWKRWRETENRAARAEADKLNAELQFLKAQINPHFLFNTLNNIYALASTKHDDAPVAILKLSNIMRYVIDEAATDYVPLESEWECVTDYVDLQKIRMTNKVYIDVSISGSIEGKRIAPLILMTYVENVFKYGISNHHQATITIKLFVEKDEIVFFCQNRIFNPEHVPSRQGIGIENNRRRLEALYPGKHVLNISKERDLYTVQLNLITT